MKEQEVPISLFSFQDIITSLTGIMVLVILVIALQMVDVVATVESRTAGVNDERAQLVSQIRAVQKAIEAARYAPDIDDDTRLRLAPFAGWTEDRLRKELDKWTQNNSSLEEALKKAIQEKAAADKQKQLNDKNKVGLEELKKQLEGVQQEIAQQEDANKTLGTQLSVAEKEKAKWEDAALKQTQKLEFSFKGNRTHTPLVIDCQRNIFRCSIYPFTNGVKECHTISEVVKWIQSQSLIDCYPLILYRRESFSKMGEIHSAVRNIRGVRKIGEEPLKDGVVVFQ